MQMRFANHPDLIIPHGNSIVWRYMGLDKFLDLLTQKRLYFTNAANFTDGYEVSLPPNILKSHRKALISKGLAGQDLEDELADFKIENEPLRDHTLVNCWSIHPHESYALWKIYLGGAKVGVAIRTTYSRVKKCIVLGENTYQEDIYTGVVQYKDYLPEKDLSRFRLITTKREFYNYEQELRLFILHSPDQLRGKELPYNLKDGRHVQVDLNLLIDKIYLSPFVASWFGDALKKILEKVEPNLASRLVLSSIRDQ
jgi:hypothetical protein